MTFEEIKERIENKVFTLDTSDCAGLPADQLTPDSSVVFKFKALTGQALDMYKMDQASDNQPVHPDTGALYDAIYKEIDSLGYTSEELVTAAEKRTT